MTFKKNTREYYVTQHFLLRTFQVERIKIHQLIRKKKNIKLNNLDTHKFDIYMHAIIMCSRVRYGYAHVANNRYDEWLMYAIGGSADPTILSEANYFAASNDPNAKEVLMELIKSFMT